MNDLKELYDEFYDGNDSFEQTLSYWKCLMINGQNHAALKQDAEEHWDWCEDEIYDSYREQRIEPPYKRTPFSALNFGEMSAFMYRTFLEHYDEIANVIHPERVN